MAEATVRAATTADIPALAQIDAWPAEAHWHSRIRDGGVLVLEAEGRVVGLARWSALWATVPFLELIEILPEHRGRGGSRRLIAALLADLKRRGYVALLSSSQTDEPDPQRWHIHMGFHSNGIIENIADDGVGEIVYRLVL
ncbi:MAG: GNAT family N-acetyltransferase [Pikeienuella sp.]